MNIDYFQHKDLLPLAKNHLSETGNHTTSNSDTFSGLSIYLPNPSLFCSPRGQGEYNTQVLNRCDAALPPPPHLLPFSPSPLTSPSLITQHHAATRAKLLIPEKIKVSVQQFIILISNWLKVERSEGEQQTLA